MQGVRVTAHAFDGDNAEVEQLKRRLECALARFRDLAGAHRPEQLVVFARGLEEFRNVRLEAEVVRSIRSDIEAIELAATRSVAPDLRAEWAWRRRALICAMPM